MTVLFETLSSTIGNKVEVKAVYFSVPSTPNLVVDGKIDAKLIEGRDLVADYATEVTFVSEKARSSFERHTKGLEWHATKASDGTSWFRMCVTEVLPEPIEIANPQKVTPNEEPPDTVSVLSDGHDRITPANLEVLAQVGLAVSDKVLAGGTLHPWRPALVASAALLLALAADGVVGIPEAYALIELREPVKLFVTEDDEVESIWGRPSDEGRFVVDSIPLSVHNLSLGDVVEADEQRVVRGVHSRGGHSTILVSMAKPKETRDSLTKYLADNGLGSEGADALVAVDVPAKDQMDPLLNFLDSFADLGLAWQRLDKDPGSPTRSLPGSPAEEVDRSEADKLTAWLEDFAAGRTTEGPPS